MNDDIGNRLKQARKASGFTQKDVAKQLGITFGAVSQWENGSTSPRGQTLIELARLYNVNPEWITTGKITKQTDELSWSGGFDPWDSSTPLDDDEVELPLFREVEMSCGAGMYEVQENHGHKLRFAKSSLKRAGVDPSSAGCAYVVGDSMYPMLPDGACVGIDTSTVSVKDGDVYAIDHGGLLRIKQLFRVPGGGLRIRSINPEYSDELVTSDQMQEDFRVIGRVFWYSAML